MKILSVIVLALLFSLSCKKKKPQECDLCPTAAKVYIYGASFSDGDSIPWRFTCSNAKQKFPGFNIGYSAAGPENMHVQSYTLIMDDPDAVPVVGKVWNHWVLYNIPDTTGKINEGLDQYGPLPAGTFRGTTSFGDTAYGGPCPPSGQKHTYVFTLYGLDLADIGLPVGATSAQVRTAMKGHILDSAVYKGTFAR